MEIRPVGIGDAAALVALWEAAGMRASVGDFWHDVEEGLARDPELFLLAESGGVLVGTVMGEFDGHRGHIYRMAVSPRHQRQGIGHRLLAELERQFRELGVRKVYADVYHDNVSGRAFWVAAGYLEDTTVVHHSKRLAP